MKRNLLIIACLVSLCTVSAREERRMEIRPHSEFYEMRGYMNHYTTTHPAAKHNPICISTFGDRIELEDGSIWRVKPNHQRRVRDRGWLPNDALIIKHSGYFADLKYVIENCNTDDVIEVILDEGPIVGGIYTYYIVDIDYFNHELALSDGSRWKINRQDSWVLEDWVIGEPLIIAIHDGWFCNEANLLINCRSVEDVRANCIG